MGQRRVRENLIFLWREDSGAFRAEVVVLNHPPAPVSNPNRILTGIPNFSFILAQNHVPAGHWRHPRIALAAHWAVPLTGLIGRVTHLYSGIPDARPETWVKWRARRDSNSRPSASKLWGSKI
jgi:hypothetical protein